MVNVKAFVYEDLPLHPSIKPITHYGDIDKRKSYAGEIAKNPIYYQKTKICKYCEALFPEHELNHALTYKMILQTDRHLIHRGLDKDLPWLDRSYLNHLDSANLYQNFKVCDSCY